MSNRILSTAYAPLLPPFQVIKYGNYLGMQIGTLIVTIQEENPSLELGYALETHSYPVVAYENKAAQMPTPHENTYMSSDEIYFHERSIMEGVVWNYVELIDVMPVCLAGSQMSWNEFVHFLWDDHVRMDSAAPLSLNTYWKLKPLGVQLQIPESTTFDVHLTTHIDCDGIVTIRSRRDDLLPLCLPFIEDTQQLAKAIYNNIAEMDCIMHDASPMSKNLIGKYFTEDEKLKGIVDYLNNNPRRVFRSKGVYIRMVDQYHGDPSGNLMSSNTPLSPASEKNLPHNSKLKSFANLVPKPECAVAVINKLHELMDSKTTPKSILMPIRAAMDAGAIHRPSWGEFCAEFGSNKLKSKTSLTYYTDTTETPYYGQAFAKMTQTFKSIIA